MPCGWKGDQAEPKRFIPNIPKSALRKDAEARLVSSQSFFTLRQVRLTVSLPTAPPNRAPSARRLPRDNQVAMRGAHPNE